MACCITADYAIAYKATELLKDIFTIVSSKLQQEQVVLSPDCVCTCMYVCVESICVQSVSVYPCEHGFLVHCT